MSADIHGYWDVFGGYMATLNLAVSEHKSFLQAGHGGFAKLVQMSSRMLFELGPGVREANTVK